MDVDLGGSLFINEAANVLIALRELTGQKIDDINVVKKYVTSEENTIYYFDDKMNSRMDRFNSKLVWIDTGFKNCNGNAIFVLLSRCGDGYVGHITGTASTLKNKMMGYYPKNRKQINTNYDKFISKYKNKTANRTTTEIVNVNEYLVAVNNRDSGATDENVFTMFFKEHPEIVLPEPEQGIDENIETNVESNVTEFTKFEEEITVGLLLDKLDGMQEYITHLLEIIEDMKATNEEEIAVLKKQCKEYSEALLLARNYNEIEQLRQNQLMDEEDAGIGHSLLEHGKKILVIGGSAIDISVFTSIAKKSYGFEKKDLEFEVDYDKAKKIANDYKNSTRYAAIIIGTTPHKTTGTGNNTSLVAAFKNESHADVVVDARTASGELKLTKESFRNAMTEIIGELSQQQSEYKNSMMRLLG